MQLDTRMRTLAQVVCCYLRVSHTRTRRSWQTTCEYHEYYFVQGGAGVLAQHPPHAWPMGARVACKQDTPFIRDVRLAPDLNNHLLSDTLYVCICMLEFNWLTYNTYILLYTAVSILWCVYEIVIMTRN